ncbi:hypothetical protein ACFW2V_13925 [Streptomyces sp. NPDC058947]|uniref:hypothetical protein n=1 Tax=Streptomyces sp. NPDC058947 TaxID=3346675 RepID=UPI0036A879D9
MNEISEPQRMLVDPQTATRWLAGVPADYVTSRLIGAGVADLMRTMRNGEWDDDSPVVINIGEDGVALTGLMRLTAVVFANVRVWMRVRLNVPRSALHLVYSEDSHPDLRDFARQPRKGTSEGGKV